MYEKYIEEIEYQLTLQPQKWDFKRKNGYNDILEHVNENIGNEYLKIIKEKFITFYEKNINLLKIICEINDKYGRTVKRNFKDFMVCSPSNLRYILHSILILQYMKDKNLNNIDIIEIGGGYGGLCLFIYKMAPLFDIKIKSYTIFDLRVASKLQEKYLNVLEIKNTYFYQIDNYKNINKNSFLISNYAFSEIRENLRKEYTEKLINPYTTFGFLVWNCNEIYNFVEGSIITTETEYPCSRKENLYVRFFPPNKDFVPTN